MIVSIVVIVIIGISTVFVVKGKVRIMTFVWLVSAWRERYGCIEREPRPLPAYDAHLRTHCHRILSCWCSSRLLSFELRGPRRSGVGFQRIILRNGRFAFEYVSKSLPGKIGPRTYLHAASDMCSRDPQHQQFWSLLSRNLPLYLNSFLISPFSPLLRSSLRILLTPRI